jgi:hypothetical protein
LRRVQRIDIEVLPPCAFVAALVMKHAMMKPAGPLDQIRLALKRVAAVSRYEGRFYSARKLPSRLHHSNECRNSSAHVCKTNPILRHYAYGKEKTARRCRAKIKSNTRTLS